MAIIPTRQQKLQSMRERRRGNVLTMRGQLTGIQKVDGNFNVPNLMPSRSSITKMNSVLRNQDYIIEQEDKNFKTEALATDFLANLNCSLVPLGPKYSLVQTQTSQIKIDNPNIVNRRDRDQGNMQITATRSYPNECDPFYNLDDQMSNEISGEMKNIRKAAKPDMIMTAAFISQLNAGERRNRLKQFLDAEQAFRRSDY